jgi:hypothetical protein
MTSYSVTIFKKAIPEVPKRLCADSNSEKSDPLFSSGRPSYASERPSVSSSRIVQDSIRSDIIATCPDALHSSRSFQLSFADTEWEDETLVYIAEVVNSYFHLYGCG